MRGALVLAAALAGCGVKAPPRPPLAPGEQERPRAAAGEEQASAERCPPPAASAKAP